MIKWILAVWMLAVAGAVSAQAQFPKGEIRRAVKLLQKERARVPLPRLMSTDRDCIREMYDLTEWDLTLSQLKADSIHKRHAENMFIQERVAAIDTTKVSAKMAYAMKMIGREELRYALYERECEKMARDRVADARTAPKGELLSVSYNSIGMRYHPDLPVTIAKEGADSARVTYSRHNISFNVGRKYLDMMHETIIRERLYQLHSNYNFRSWSLPDIPEQRILDGQRWTVEAQYSDGTVISSSGMMSSGLNVNAISRLFLDTILPLRPERQQE